MVPRERSCHKEYTYFIFNGLKVMAKVCYGQGLSFYAPGSNDRGHIVFVPSVCLSVCLSVVNFNLRYNF